MSFFLSKSDFNFLKNNIPYAYKLVENVHTHTDNIYFDVNNIGDFQDEISGEIVESGMDDDDTVNKNGMRMYHIYDEILYQKHNTV